MKDVLLDEENFFYDFETRKNFKVYFPEFNFQKLLQTHLRKKRDLKLMSFINKKKRSMMSRASYHQGEKLREMSLNLKRGTLNMKQMTNRMNSHAESIKR